MPSAHTHHPDIVVRPATRHFVLVLCGVLFAVGTFGSNIGPAWLDKRPAVVLAMSARNRNLFGSVPYMNDNWLLYGALGLGRLMLAGVALFFLGRWYGRRAIEWTEGQVGELPKIYGWFQRGIDRAGWLMVLLMPASNFVCLMAGHRRMAPKRFVTYLSLGIIAKLVVLWVGGKVFEDQIRWFLDAIEGYQWWIVGGLFLLTFLQSAKRIRKDIPEVIHELESDDEIVIHDSGPDEGPDSGPGSGAVAESAQQD